MKATREQLLTWNDNARLALRLWKERVKPEQVDLGLWHCSTHACFGGWLAVWPEFQAMGIGPNRYGAPALLNEMDARGFMLDIAEETDVPTYLFGDGWMFAGRSKDSGGDFIDFDSMPDLTDHEIVVQRLERRLAEIINQMRELND